MKKDDGLRNDFNDRVNSLSSGTQSYELSQAIMEAGYWENEYGKARQIQALGEETFTEEIRANWEHMDADERVKILEDYMDEAFLIMFTDIDPHTGYLTFDAKGYGVQRFGWDVDNLGMNPMFRDLATGNYSLDKAIDTLIHEVRHSYQAQIEYGSGDYSHIPDSVKSDWGLEYIPPRKPDDWPSGDPWPYTYYDYYSQPTEADAKSFSALARPIDVSISIGD